MRYSNNTLKTRLKEKEFYKIKQIALDLKIRNYEVIEKLLENYLKDIKEIGDKK